MRDGMLSFVAIDGLKGVNVELNSKIEGTSCRVTELSGSGGRGRSYRRSSFAFLNLACGIVPSFQLKRAIRIWAWQGVTVFNRGFNC